jgi:C-terminal processing protease CtpA/Prc
VNLSKGSRGLGFSVTGGIDCQNEPWPGIIRIKRLFPHQPAWQDGKLAPGDVLLEADGTPLTGLTNYVSFGKFIRGEILTRCVFIGGP